MNNEDKEMMLDLLCKQATEGLDEREAKELARLEYDARDAESIELTVAALGLVDLDTNQELPAHLRSKIIAGANNYFATRGVAASDLAPADPSPVRQIVLNDGPVAKPWFGWLGWAAAAAASIALAINLFAPGPSQPFVSVPPSPTPDERRAPAEQRQRLMDAPGMVMARWDKGKVKEFEDLSGDVVWNDQQQDGYLRLKGLPKNDAGKETYQLWIVDETQDPKTPIDGGTFDIRDDGEVIIRVDAKLRVKNPKAFAITIEKAGGVVVSKGEKMVVAPVKPNQV